MIVIYLYSFLFNKTPRIYTLQEIYTLKKGDSQGEGEKGQRGFRREN